MQAGLFQEHTCTIYTFILKEKSHVLVIVSLWHNEKMCWTWNFKAISNILDNSLN